MGVAFSSSADQCPIALGTRSSQLAMSQPVETEPALAAESTAFGVRFICPKSIPGTWFTGQREQRHDNSNFSAERFPMLNLGRLGVLTFALMVLFLTSSRTLGQASSSQADVKSDRANLDVQLHLLLASNEPGDRNMLPSLEPVVRQFKATLPLTNYRLAATFANRIKSGGTLEVKGVFSSDVFATIANSFYEFTMSQIKLSGEGDNQSIDIARLRFGLRLPVVTGTNRADANTSAMPNISYEMSGVSTELSLREGTPTVFGTLTTTKPNQLLVLVITVKRAS